jgi:lipopolysaccharide export system protein LptA
VQQEKLATGEKAVYYKDEERVVMTGSPKVTEGENFVEGQEITLYLNEKRSVVSGGTGGRVNAVFTPRSEGNK